MFPEEQCGLSQSLRAVYREHCLKTGSSKARYKDISIMQMNGIFSVGGGSSGSQLPLPRPMGSLSALKGFSPLYSLPLSNCTSECPQEKPLRGPRLSRSTPLGAPPLGRAFQPPESHSLLKS